MPSPSFTGKKSAKPEMDARQQVWGGGDVFQEWFMQNIEVVWQGRFPGQKPVPSHFSDIGIGEESGGWLANELKRLFIVRGYKESEEGLDAPTFQVIATFQGEHPQEYINFGGFAFNDCSVEQFKEWAEEQFDADFKDILKLSCEWRGEAPEHPYNAPQWFRDANGKCWWHENTCSVCSRVFVDATNPDKCPVCRPEEVCQCGNPGCPGRHQGGGEWGLNFLS